MPDIAAPCSRPESFIPPPAGWVPVHPHFPVPCIPAPPRDPIAGEDGPLVRPWRA